MSDGQRQSRAPAAPFGGFYLVSLVGALVWFWQQADGFWGHLVAVLKALVWPAFLVYEGFRALAG